MQLQDKRWLSIQALFSMSIFRIFFAAFASANENCRSDHPQQKFCRSHFVLKGTVKSDGEIQGDFIRLEFATRTQIKISDQFSKLDDESLQSVWISLLDKPELKLLQGQKYIVSGTIQTIMGLPRLYVSHCDWVARWHDLNSRQKAFLHKDLYQKNCHCATANRGFAFCESTSKTTSAKSGSKHEVAKSKRKHAATKRSISEASNRSCHEMFSFCSANQKSPVNCRWSNNQQLKQCLANAAA